MQRAEEKTRVNTSKLAEFERQHDEHEAGRKAAEVKCQENIQIRLCDPNVFIFQDWSVKYALCVTKMH